MPNEQWDLYDKDYNHKGVFTSGRGYIPEGLYHKTVEVIPTDMQGHLLITRRSMQKKSAAGLWEFPAGSVLAGETEEQAVVRELREETGLRPKKIFFMQRARMRGVIRYIYLAYIPDLLTAKQTLPPEEVMASKFVTYDQWMSLVTTSNYNEYRVRVYNIKLYELLRDMVNRYADEAVTDQKDSQKEHKPLTRSNRLIGTKPRHLDKRCYEADPQTPPGMEDREPDVEQGDDGT